MKEKTSLKDINIINRPIVLVAFGLFFSCLGYGLWDYNKELAILINLLYVIFVLILDRKILFIFIILIQLIAMLNSYNYYSRFGKIEKVRVTEKRGEYVEGEAKGRKFILNGNTEKVRVGERITGAFEVRENFQKDKGIVGEININSYKLCKNDLISNLTEMREDVINKLREHIGDRKTGLVASIAYGDKDFLDSEDNIDMNRMGIIHAISVSGMHIFLIYSIFCSVLGKKISLSITTLYVVFTGGAISSIRALIMIILSVFSISARRNYDGLGAICFSAIVLMLWKPYCVFNIGFLLSYSATLGIIIFKECISMKMYKLPNFLREGISISLSAQIFTLPIIMFFFSSVSINFLLGNIFLIPIINIILILGNILPLVLYFNGIFDFLSFCLVKVINILDYVSELLYEFSYDALIVNTSIIKVTVAIFILVYFYFKCGKIIISVPLAFIIVFMLEMYSPFMTVEYYKNGVLAVRYKGESMLITNRRSVKDLKLLKKKSFSENVYLDEEEIKLNEYLFKKDNKDYILKSYDGYILLKLDFKKVQRDRTYDIIDFNKEKINKIIIVDKKIFIVY